MHGALHLKQNVCRLCMKRNENEREMLTRNVNVKNIQGRTRIRFRSKYFKVEDLYLVPR